jgi:hypothetical protein
VKAVTPIELADWLMGRGRHYIQTSDVAELLGIETDVVSDSLQRAREAGKVISVTKGGWVPRTTSGSSLLRPFMVRRIKRRWCSRSLRRRVYGTARSVRAVSSSSTFQRGRSTLRTEERPDRSCDGVDVGRHGV